LCECRLVVGFGEWAGIFGGFMVAFLAGLHIYSWFRRD
tara:strand:+ start:3686 stop:3799 length:114 start_codon:yes stop_codon:yes gene_type:complete